MPVSLDLGVTLAELDALTQHDATSAEVPKGTIEVVVDANEPEKGFGRFSVQGLARDEARMLRGYYYSFMVAVGELIEHQDRRRQELNPANLPALHKLTTAQLIAQFGTAFEIADRGMASTAKEIVRRMITGYAPGEITLKGQPLPWQAEKVVIDGEQRTVAHPRILEALRLSGLLFSVAGACLEFSEKGFYPSAAEQFEAARKQQEEAADAIGAFIRAQHPDKKAAPFLPAAQDATPDTPTSSPEPSASPLPSADTSASALETKSPATFSA